MRGMSPHYDAAMVTSPRLPMPFIEHCYPLISEWPWAILLTGNHRGRVFPVFVLSLLHNPSAIHVCVSLLLLLSLNYLYLAYQLHKPDHPSVLYFYTFRSLLYFVTRSKSRSNPSLPIDQVVAPQSATPSPCIAISRLRSTSGARPRWVVTNHQTGLGPSFSSTPSYSCLYS